MEAVLSTDVVAKVADKFDFTVDKFPLSGPDGMKTPAYGLFRSDNAGFVGSCNNAKSVNYVPHQTEDVIALVEASATLFDGEVDVACHFKDGHYVSVQPTKDKRLAVYGEKDNVFPRIIINAGYDGKAFRASMGYYRDACRNLSMMREVNGTTVSIRHMSNLRSEMNELIDTFGILGESWEGLSERILALEATRVGMASVLDTIFGETPKEIGRGKTIHENRTKAIVGRIFTEQFQTGRNPQDNPDNVSAWELFNGIQGFAQHCKSRHGDKTDFERAIMAFSDTKVQAAEKLLLSLVA